MQRYQRFDCAQLAYTVAKKTYEATAGFPADERYGLAQQMRRAAASIGSNIAEGAGRASDADFHRFLSFARGSASELHFQTMLALDFGFVDNANGEEILELIDRTKATVSGLMKRLAG